MAVIHNIETWKILLIEDNPLDTKVIQESLKDVSSKIKLEITDRLSTGMDILDRENFDALLLDLNLPDAMGLEALKRIINFKTDLPIIILTGLADDELGSKAIREGAQDYLFKQSVDTSSLARSIRYAIERKQVEKQLRMNEERIRESQKNLSMILDTIHTGVVIIDKKSHQIVDANSKAVEMIGASEEEIVNSVCHKFICPANKGQCPVTDLGKKVDQSERILLTAGGEVIPIIKTVTPVTLSGHEYLVESFTDISERKSIEQHLMKSRAKFEYLVRKNPAVIYSCEPRGEFQTTFMSENVRELSGYESQEFLSKPNFWVNCMHSEDRERVFSSFSELPEKGHYNETYRIKHKNGTYRWVFEEAKLLKDKQGDPLEIVGYWTDISRLKQTEFELNESESRYLELVEDISDIFFSLSPDGIIISLNKAFETLTGWSRKDFIGNQFIDLLHPDDIPTTSTGFKAISRGGKISNIGMRIKTKLNEFLILEGRVTPQYNDGKLIGFVGVARDISERKKAEDALRESEERLRSFMEASPDILLLFNEDLNLIEVNKATIARYPSVTKKEEILGTNILEIAPNIKETGFSEQYEKVLRTGEPISLEEVIHHPKFGKMIISLKAFKVGRGLGIIERDITEHVRLEETIRESEEKYRLLVEKSSEGIAIIQDQRYKYVNPSFAKTLGHSSDELINFTPEEIWSLIHPDDKECLKNRNRDLEAGRPLVPRHIFRYIKHDGSIKWVEAFVTDILFKERPALQVFENDITERMLSEIKLRESEEKYRTILEIIEEGYYEVDLAGNFTFFNDALAKSLGYSNDEIMGVNHRQFMDPETSKKVYRIFNEVYRTGKPNKVYSYKIIRKDGKYRFHEGSCALIFDPNGKPTGFRGIIRDITDRKQLEISLIKQTSRLQERVKELNCLYNVIKLTSNPERSLEYVLHKILSLIPKAWQNPENLCARIIFKEEILTTDKFEETQWRQFAKIVIDRIEVGRIDVFQLEELPKKNGKLFLKEEQDLIEALAREISEFVEFKRANEALKESEDRYRTLFEEMPIGLYRTTPDGKFLAVNSVFLKMLGFTTQDPSLGDVFNLASKIEYPRGKFQEMIEKEGEISGLELQVKKLDGSDIFIRENAKAVRNRNGSVLYYEGSFEDITERKLLEETLFRLNDELAKKVQSATQDLVKEKTRIETIVETTPVGMLVLNSDGSLVLANKTFNDLYQRIFQENLPYDFNISTLPDSCFINEIKQNFVSIESSPRTIEPIEGLYLQIHSAPMGFPGEQPFGVLTEFYDVTPFIEFEITQKQFIATVSHELRTPMTILDLSIKNLQKYWKKLSEKQREEVFSLVIKSTFSLKQIIEDVLIISKIETREFKLQKEPFFLRKVLNDMIAQFDSRLREFGVTVTIDVNPQLELYGDPKRIGKIFSILLDNAIKFSPDGESTVKFNVIDDYKGEYNPEEVDGVLIEVIDSGRGIPEKDIPKVFDQFFRSLDAKDIPGIGIGLFIAKTLVKHHQGHIFVKSVIRKGSTFSVFLPKNESNQINSNT